jgi:trimethylamine:corrinoid methyltransferase-like protein
MVSKVLEEIHKIRENIYKEQKGLTTKEVVKKIHKEAEEVIKKYGLRFRRKEKIVSHK